VKGLREECANVRILTEAQIKPREGGKETTKEGRGKRPFMKSLRQKPNHPQGTSQGKVPKKSKNCITEGRKKESYFIDW